MTELKSDKLTGLLQGLAKLEKSAKQESADILALTRKTGAQVYDKTVVNVDNEKAFNAQKAGAVHTGEPVESERDADLRRTLAGEPLAQSSDIRVLLDLAHRKRAATEDAIEHTMREIAKKKNVLAIEHCKSIKPKHDEQMRRLCKLLFDVHAVWSEIDGDRRELIDSGVGLRGVYLTLPDFLSTPNNQYSEFAAFMRAAKEAGFVNSIPKEFKL